MKILHKIATVLVTLLLYFVIVILQTPKAARADAPACPMPASLQSQSETTD